MSKYTLSINIRAESRELLESLLVTLETVNGDVSQLNSLELLTISGPVCLDLHEAVDECEPTVLQRNLFLDKWCFQN